MLTLERQHIAVILVVLSAGFVVCQTLKIFPNLHEQVSTVPEVKVAPIIVEYEACTGWVG